MGSTERPRLLAIGIDGADYAIADWLLRQGRLPNLKALADRGAWGPLRSTVPPVTPPAWTTLMTGKNPGKHGVFDFLSMNGRAWNVPVACRRRARTLWRALSSQGYRVGTFNLPGTYPPEPLSAFQVSGLTAPDAAPTMAYPPRAWEVLQATVREHAAVVQPGEASERDAEWLHKRVDLVLASTRALLQAFPCDVCMVNFQAVDMVQHSSLPREMTPGDVTSLNLDGLVAMAYDLVDDRIGVMLDEWSSDDTTILVASDHGGTLVDRVVNLEKLFLDEGLLAYTSASTGQPSRVEEGRSRARTAVRRWGAVKQAAPRLARLLAPLARRMRARVSAYESDLQVDWSRTQAIPWGFYGQVRFNVEGRDPKGIVPRSEVPALSARIQELLLSLTDPVTGQPIYREVRPGSEAYSGPFVPEGPDLVALPHSDRYLTVCGRMFAESRLPLLDAQEHVAVALDAPRDFHSSLGVFMAAGPEVQPGQRLPESGLADFAPTALYLLGEPVPAGMDGRVLSEAIRPEVLGDRPVRETDPWPDPDPVVVYTEDEQRQLEDNLRSLGYI